MNLLIVLLSCSGNLSNKIKMRKGEDKSNIVDGKKSPNNTLDNQEASIWDIDLDLSYDEFKIELDKLIESGVDINGRNKYGDVIIRKLLAKGKFDKCEYLIEKGADINIKNIHNGVNLMEEMVCKNKVKACKFLIDKGFDIDTVDSTGSSLFCVVLRDNDFETCKFLLEKGADINARDDFGHSLLEDAIKSRDVEKIRFLLENGADVNIKDDRGNRPLHILASESKEGDIEIFKLLLEYGADINAKNNYNITYLYKIVQKRDVEKINCLLKLMEDDNYKDKININIVNSVGNTVLHLLANMKYEKGDELICKSLIKHGASVEIMNQLGPKGELACEIAKSRGNMHMEIATSVSRYNSSVKNSLEKRY